MNEKTTLPTRETTSEDIYDTDYVKSVGIEQVKYGFFLRVVHEHFTPCQHCQGELHRIIDQADELYLGNKSYEPAIELRRFWELDDTSWREVERHPATEKDFIALYGTEKGIKYWKDYQEQVDEEA